MGTKTFIKNLLTKEKFAVLATRGPRYAEAFLMAYAASRDLKSIFFATLKDDGKYQNLKRSGRASLLIDDRKNSSRDYQQAAALTALGTARELTGARRSKAVRIFLKKHSSLKSFLSDPRCALFELKVETFKLVTRFREAARPSSRRSR